jgi:hypothetical protein
MLRRLVLVVPLMSVVLAGFPTSRANAALGPATTAATAVDLPSLTRFVASGCARFHAFVSARQPSGVPHSHREYRRADCPARLQIAMRLRGFLQRVGPVDLNLDRT